MTQKNLLTYALHGVENKFKVMCEIVADGATVVDKDIDDIMELINDRAEIKAKLMEGGRTGMKKYIVIDTYEGEQVIGRYDTYEEALTAAKQFTEDTDGECHLLIGYLKEEQE